MDRGLESGSSQHRPGARRAILKAALASGLALPLTRILPRLAPEASAQRGDPRSQRPQAGDGFAFQTGERAGQVITITDVPTGGPPVTACPIDRASGVVRDGSRLNQVLLVRFGGAELSEETRLGSAEGIVAYSGICTHTGCDIALWKPETKRFRCPCHESEFDPRDGGRVVGGPAPRRLPRVPVRIVDGVPVAAGGFTSRPGFQPS